MAEDLRSKFKATPIKSLKKQVDEDNSMIGASSNEYLSLEDGKTLKIRIFPSHPDGEDFYIAKKSYWLSVAKKDGDMGRTTVLDSRLHGGTAMDVVEEYTKMAKKFCAKDSDKLDKISGDKDSLKPSYTWMAYASIIKADEELHPMLWEFKKMVRDAMNKLSFSEDDDDAIETDPFTDPDEGLPILVKYMKSPNKKKGENYYEVSFPKKAVAYPLSEEVLESFMGLKPLSEVLPKYNMRDFDKAVEGLQNFDDENEIGLFNEESWLEKLEEIKAQYDSIEDDEDEKKPVSKKVVKPSAKPAAKPATKPSKVVEDDEDEVPAKKVSKAKSGDEFDDMDREELKEYIAENDLDVRVKKSMEDDEIRDAIREAVNESSTTDDETGAAESDEFDAMDREELKEYIADNDLDVRVKKSMEDDEIRAAIREAVSTESGSETTSEEEEEPKAKMSLKDIQAKLAKKK